MRILILGAGKMGSFFTDILSFQHETAVYDTNPMQLRFVYNTYRFTTLDEIKDFEPELVINAVTVKYTLDAFRQVLPVLPKDCIISDIASVKTGLKRFYEESGFRYVSTHPMFGPTFASLSNLSHERERLPLRLHPPHVRPHLRQPQQPEPRERHHHHRGRPPGTRLLQGPLPDAEAEHLRVHL